MEKIAGIILLVERIDASVAFYKKLGFEVSKEVPNAATTLRLGDFWVELLHKSHVVTEDYKKDIAIKDKGAGIYLQIRVRDVDECYATIANNGVRPTGKPENYPWQQREFIVIDPDGYKIAFFSPI